MFYQSLVLVAMFSILYEHSLVNLPLVRLSSSPSGSPTHNGDSNDNGSGGVTLGNVMQSSRYVLFCVLHGVGSPDRSERSKQLLADFFGIVCALMRQRNGGSSKGSKSGNGTSPKRLRKLLNSLRISKKSTTGNGESVVDENGGEMNVSTVILDLEPTATVSDISTFDESGFYYMPLNFSTQYVLKGRLLRALKYAGVTPLLTVVDAGSLRVLTGHGRRMLVQDPSGEHFPWVEPSLADLFKGSFIRNVRRPAAVTGAPPVEGTQPSEEFIAELHNFASARTPIMKALFFGAKWCPPCRELARELSDVYDNLKAAVGDDFELFFCSSDRSEASFRENFATMPWCAMPFGQETLTSLTHAYDVNGIPSLLLIDERNRLFSRNGRCLMRSDPKGERFPWHRQPLIELNIHNFHQIYDTISLILFTEGQLEDEPFAKDVLRKAADALLEERQTADVIDANNEQTNNDDPALPRPVKMLAADFIQVFYTGEDPICDYIMEDFALSEALLPLLLICDVYAGHMVVCDLPDVTETIVADFVDDYRAGRARVYPLPHWSKRAMENEDVGAHIDENRANASVLSTTPVVLDTNPTSI